VGGALAALALLSSSPALADPPSPRAAGPGPRTSAATAPPTDSARRADAIFREGQTLHDKGAIHEACEKFAEAQRIDPALGGLLNLASCHADEGRTATAHAEFVEADRLASQRGAAEKERQQFAHTQALEMEKKLSVVLLLGAPEAGVTEVQIDGKALDRAAWAAPIELDPGEHTFSFAAPGKTTQHTKFVVASIPGTQRLTVPSFEQEAPPPPAPATVPWMRIASYAAGGVGLASLGVTAYLGARAIGKKHASEARCTGKYCDPTGLDLDADAHRSAAGATATFFVGLAGVGAGVALFVLSRPASSDKPSAVRVLPVAGPRIGGLAVDGRW
jgi:hypothetical protein